MATKRLKINGEIQCACGEGNKGHFGPCAVEPRNNQSTYRITGSIEVVKQGQPYTDCQCCTDASTHVLRFVTNFQALVVHLCEYHLQSMVNVARYAAKK